KLTSLDVPPAFERVDVLIVFAVLVAIDAVADKVMWLDSAWDVVNTAIRPIAGATVAVLIASPNVDLPATALAVSGGTVALVTHLAKATTRLAVNASPEPASNIAVSFGEDLAIVFVVLLAIWYPWVAAGVALTLFLIAVVIALLLLKVARAALRNRREAKASVAANPAQGTELSQR
ncbi:MAG: DUF4126 domain-containing protein, partial [Actinomycetales bacterium]